MQRPQRLPSNPAKVYDLGFKTGADHGFEEARTAALNWLQEKYITDPNRPERGSAEGNALLEVARQLQLHMSEVKMKRIA